MDQAPRNKIQVPGGGEYFYHRDDMLEVRRRNANQGFAMAADKEASNGKKCYGLYPSMVVFFTYLMACPTRYAYELLTNNTKCRAYTDVEWKQPKKGLDWPCQMDMVLDHLRIKAMRMYGVDADFKVLVSSREDKGLWKYSFHIIITNLVFNNNNDGTMHSFFNVTDDMGNEWFWNDNGTRKAIMDQKVYDSNCCFRLPYCCKKGKNSPMLPLKAPLHEMQVDDNTDPEHLAEFTVTHMSHPYTLVPSIEPSPVLKSKASRTRPVISSSVLLRRSYPAVASKLEKLLADAGDTVSKVSKVNYNPDDDTYFIQCQNNNHIRKCLRDPTRSHDSNNCILRLTPRSSDFKRSLQCWYTCCHPDCKQIGSLSLGFVSLDQPPVPPVISLSMDQPPVPPVISLSLDQPPVGSTIFNRPPDEQLDIPHLSHFPPYRAVAVRSPCGTGKTKAMDQTLISMASTQQICVVYVTHRRTLSLKAVSMLPRLNGRCFEHYNTISGDIHLVTHPLLVCQYEALGRITDLLTIQLPIICICDEFLSIGHQMHSKYGDVAMAQCVFDQLMKLSAHVFALDGYFDQIRLDIFEKYVGCPAYLIHNTFKSR